MLRFQKVSFNRSGILEDTLNRVSRPFDQNQLSLFTKDFEDFLKRKPEASREVIFRWSENKIRDDYPFWKVDPSKIEGYKDYRLASNRMDMALKNVLTRMLAGDLDHWHSAHVAADMLDLTQEQKAWHAMFFGYSYRTQWATIAIQLFPDPASVDITKLHAWSDSGNWARIPVGRDCRYQPRHFPAMVEGLQNLIGDNTLYETLERSATSSTDHNENFRNLAKIISGCSRFGRMTTFLAMQHLFEFFDWPISGYEMMMENQNTWSSRTGQWFLDDNGELNEEELVEKGHPSPTPEELHYLNESVADTLNKLNKDLPFVLDVFNLESEQCETYDKYFLKSREFNFWTSIELSELTNTIIDKWSSYEPSEDFPLVPDMTSLIVAQFVKRPYEMGGSWQDEKWHKTAKHLGLCINHNLFLKDSVDLYKNLPIKKLGEIKVERLINAWNSAFSEEEQEELRKKYDPRRYLRWKKNLRPEMAYNKLLLDQEMEFVNNLDHMEDWLYHPRRDFEEVIVGDVS